jgi:type II secretory pathway pseudopilin PulG
MTDMTDDRGETLIELLISITIASFAVAAIMGGMALGINVSSIHRDQARTGNAVRDFAEVILTKISNNGYTDCATPASFTPPTDFAGRHGDLSPKVTTVEYWENGAWKSTCGTDQGLQRLHLEATGKNATERLVIVVRKPCGGPACA